VKGSALPTRRSFYQSNEFWLTQSLNSSLGLQWLEVKNIFEKGLQKIFIPGDLENVPVPDLQIGKKYFDSINLKRFWIPYSFSWVNIVVYSQHFNPLRIPTTAPAKNFL
jgi:hypothetical protein